MSIAFSKPRQPEAIPEHSLWTVTKGTRTAEARVRMTPGGIELRFYVHEELIWSQLFQDGRELGELAEQKKAEFQAMGWTDDGTR